MKSCNATVLQLMKLIRAKSKIEITAIRDKEFWNKFQISIKKKIIIIIKFVGEIKREKYR